MTSALFAIEDATVISAAMAAVAMIGGGWASFMSYKTTAVKAQFDAERIQDRARIATLEHDVVECHKQSEAQKVARDLQIAELTRRMDENQKGVKSLRDHHGVEDTH